MVVKIYTHYTPGAHMNGAPLGGFNERKKGRRKLQCPTLVSVYWAKNGKRKTNKTELEKNGSRSRSEVKTPR